MKTKEFTYNPKTRFTMFSDDYASHDELSLDEIQAPQKKFPKKMDLTEMRAAVHANGGVTVGCKTLPPQDVLKIMKAVAPLHGLRLVRV